MQKKVFIELLSGDTGKQIPGSNDGQGFIVTARLRNTYVYKDLPYMLGRAKARHKDKSLYYRLTDADYNLIEEIR